MPGEQNGKAERLPYSTQHKLPPKTLVWSTLGVTLLMAALYAVLGFPPAFHSFYQSMYFHSIGIGLAALAVYMVVGAFDLEGEAPKLDFPLSVRAWVATLFAAGGGIIFITHLDVSFTDIGYGMYIVAFILLADVGGALYIELMLMPRKRYGSYDPKAGYYRRMFPFTKEMRKAYKGVGAAYWLAMAAIGSAFIAGLIGLVNLWVGIFGTSFFSGLTSSLGLDAAGFIEATKDPHTHAMAIAIMVGVVAIAVQQYKVLESLSGFKKYLARTGLWISFIGVISLTVVYVAIAFANYSPPNLFVSGPADINGIAGDDVVLSIAAIGAMVLVVPVALAKIGPEGRPFWKDGVRLSLVGTWVLAVFLNIAAGYWVELHHDSFTTTLAANDSAYAQFQSMVALFVLLGAALILLAVDQSKVTGAWRRVIGSVMGVGLLVTTFGGLAWAFVDPTQGLAFWSSIAGLFVIGIAGALTVSYVFRTKALPGTS
jgi:hypothetical protein